ncbi:hypothetical protein [Jidongwangia harbinensis]|uniref:hypothetical protein n=1 Tax=Jidongwangia harbinensis TaxID=2878561 RepID=UPI001CD9EECD|nr:hypothetical protein [Jidongwangia harbinensis]MCA2217879.1 hypothetical protein [Jidongwangia harbinensis]
MLIKRLTVCAAAVAVLTVAGCARADQDTPPGAPAPPPSSQPAMPSSPATATPGAAGGQTHTGTVVAGVEENCLLLESDGGPYLLILEDESLRSAATVGSRVTVTGRAEPGMMTTCQQGTPFTVTAISPS